MAKTATNFSLFWLDPETGDTFVSHHQFHGRQEQAGYSRSGWMLHAIEVYMRRYGWALSGSRSGRHYEAPRFRRPRQGRSEKVRATSRSAKPLS
jgi:hypothetical protein